MSLKFTTYRNGSTDVFSNDQLIGELEETGEGHHFRSKEFGDTSASFDTVEQLKTHLEATED